MTRPMPPPNAKAPLIIAIAPCRRSAGISSRSTDSASGKIAVATPCSARPTSSTPSESASADTTEPTTAKPRTPSSVGFLPYRSPMRPSSGVDTAADSSVAVVTQLTDAVEVCSLVAMRPRIGTAWVCMTVTIIAANASTPVSRAPLRAMRTPPEA